MKNYTLLPALGLTAATFLGGAAYGGLYLPEDVYQGIAQLSDYLPQELTDLSQYPENFNLEFKLNEPTEFSMDQLGRRSAGALGVSALTAAPVGITGATIAAGESAVRGINKLNR